MTSGSRFGVNSCRECPRVSPELRVEIDDPGEPSTGDPVSLRWRMLEGRWTLLSQPVDPASAIYPRCVEQFRVMFAAHGFERPVNASDRHF
jgi:hypothetical protein